jgi:hypothetical protein
MKEYKDCLACGYSHSEESENNDDKLYCILKQKYVNEEDCCEDFN